MATRSAGWSSSSSEHRPGRNGAIAQTFFSASRVACAMFSSNPSRPEPLDGAATAGERAKILTIAAAEIDHEAALRVDFSEYGNPRTDRVLEKARETRFKHRAEPGENCSRSASTCSPGRSPFRMRPAARSAIWTFRIAFTAKGIKVFGELGSMAAPVPLNRMCRLPPQDSRRRKPRRTTAVHSPGPSSRSSRDGCTVAGAEPFNAVNKPLTTPI